MRTPIVGGNWKMNTDARSARTLADAVAERFAAARLESRITVAIFPPFVYLQSVHQSLRDRSSAVLLGAQDVSEQPDGAFTGEISCAMLKDIGVGIVLTGHSERRHVIGETDELINHKTRAVLSAGLRVILCVGETLAQREAHATDTVNERQLRAGLAGVSTDDLARVVIAYEPVWAIGTGRTATPADAQDAHKKIRSVLATLHSPLAAAGVSIQYGGSVKGANAAELMKQPDIDGGLIGGASLKADEFMQIVNAAAATA